MARKTIFKVLWLVGLWMLVGLGGANGAFSVLGMPYSGVETFTEREYTWFQNAITEASVKDVEMQVLAYGYKYEQFRERTLLWDDFKWDYEERTRLMRTYRVKYRVWVERGHHFPYGNPIPYAEYLWQLLIIGGVIFGVSFAVKPKPKSQL